jgi:hypothetical protein
MALEKMKEHSSWQVKSKVRFNSAISSQHVQQVLPALLDKCTSMALMTMSRISKEHRIKNHTFRTALQRKLRLPIFSNTSEYRCKSGAVLDLFGDHCLGCKANRKTKSSNGIRDEIIKIIKRILPFVGIIDSVTQLECETHNIVPSLPRLQPLDLSIRLDHSLDSGHWKTPYNCIGFDVTIIHSTKSSSSTTSEAAKYNEMDLHLRDVERMKLARQRGGTNPITARTVPPDGVIGEIINSNQAFIPIAVGPFGGFGSLFCRFIDDVNTLSLPTFPTDSPNAARAAKLATNYRTPYNVFGKADEKWKAMNPSKCLDGSYLSQLPSTWANQKLGLATSTHLANHVNNSLTKLTFCKGSSTQSESDS